MKSKKYILLLALILICSFIIPSIAVAENSESTDTLQQSYQNKFDAVQSNEELSDKEKVLEIVDLFFHAKAANYISDSEDVDFSFFINNTDNSFNRNKIMNSIKLQKVLRKNSGSTITSDNLTLTINNIAVKSDTATISLYECYSYQLSDTEKPSCTGIEYTLELTRIDGSWLITKIDSNDETVNDDMGSDSFDVEEASKYVDKVIIIDEVDLFPGITSLGNKTNVNAKDSISTLSYLSNPINRFSAFLVPLTYTVRTFISSDAADYAYEYAIDYNDNQFPSYSGDCQNFASQCVWAGLRGTTTYATSYVTPMFSDWYSTDNDTYGASDPWCYVTHFYTEAIQSYIDAYTYGGFYGYEVDIAHARPGQVIQLYDANKNDGIEEWDHSYVIYRVTGTDGSRTRSDIFICSHTSDRRDVRLSLYWSGTLRVIDIEGVLYQ